jgi:hypothetical protein
VQVRLSLVGADWVLVVGYSEARPVLVDGSRAQDRHSKSWSVHLPVPLYHQTNTLCYQAYPTRAVEDWAQRPFAYGSVGLIPRKNCVMLSLFPTRSSWFVLCTGNQHRPKESTCPRLQMKIIFCYPSSCICTVLIYHSGNISQACLFSAISNH